MPLPDYGYRNKEDSKHQELVFEMAPEFVDDERHSQEKDDIYSKLNMKKKRAQVTTGNYSYWATAFQQHFCWDQRFLHNVFMVFLTSNDSRQDRHRPRAQVEDRH